MQHERFKESKSMTSQKKKLGLKWKLRHIYTEPDFIVVKLNKDLKVLRRSPDLLNNFKTGQGQLQLKMKHILFYHIWGLQPFWSSILNNLTAQ